MAKYDIEDVPDDAPAKYDIEDAEPAPAPSRLKPLADLDPSEKGSGNDATAGDYLVSAAGGLARATPFARNISAAVNTLGGGSYRENLAALDRDIDAAAGKNAFTKAAYVAPRVTAGLGFGAAMPLSAQVVQGAGSALADGGTVGDAALAGGLSLGLGRLAGGAGKPVALPFAQYTQPAADFVSKHIKPATDIMSKVGSSPVGRFMSTARPRTAGAIGVGMGAGAAANSDAPDGERIAAGLDALWGARGIVKGQSGASYSKKASDAERWRADAERNAADATQREVDAQGLKQVAREEDFKGDYAGKVKDAVQGAEALNRNVDQAVRSQVGDAKGEFDANKRQAQRDAQNNADQRATADDAQQRLRNDEITRQREENLKANDARRLSGVEHKIEMLDLREQHKAAVADWDAKVAAAKSADEKVRAELDRADSLEAIKTKAQQSYEREKARLTKEAQGEGMTLEQALASAEGRLRQVYGTGAGRTRDVFEMADKGLVEGGVDPRYVERGKLFGKSLNESGSEETDIADAILAMARENGGDIPKAKADWLAGEAQRRMEKANAGDPEAKAALEALKAPTDADAQAALAEKERASRVLDPAVRARADEILKANGIDPATVTDEQIINREFGASTPPKPAAPDDTEHQRAMLDFEKRKIENGRQAVPPAPDRMASRLANRQDRAAVRNAPEFVPPDVNRSAIAADLAPGYPDMPAADKAPNLPNQPMDRDAFRARVERGIAEGRRSVETGLKGPKGTGRDLLAQYLRELPESGLSTAARVGGLGVAGLGAGLLAGGGPFGALAGAGVGTVASKFLSRPKESYLGSEFLGQSKSPAGTMEGEPQRLQFSQPDEAAAIFREVAPELRARSDKSLASGAGASKAALMDLLNNEGFRDFLRKREEEKKATAPDAPSAAPTLSGNGGLGGSLVNPRLGLEIQRLLKDPATRAWGEELLRRAKLGMSMSTPVIP